MALPQGSDAGLDAEYDPFAAFTAKDSVVGDVRDPHPRMARVRREQGVERSSERIFAAGRTDVPPIFTVHRYDDVCHVLRETELFSSARYDQVTGPVMGRTILEMDPPEHQPHRSLVAQAFRPRALERWTDEMIRPLIDDLIDAFADRGHAELVREFTVRFPVMVIAAILGLPREHYNRFLRWSMELISVSQDWERGTAASAALREYLGEILRARREDPRDDLISELVMAEFEGHTLTDEEILPFLNLLLPAGAETTYRSSGNLLFGLLTHPDQLEAVRADRSLLPQAIEEGLRWEPPLLFIFRTAREDTELAGVPIPSGAQLMINLGSANRDETRWDDPDAFDIFRTMQQHVAFAHGPHMCLGMHLARMETRVAVEALFDRLPDLRLDPAAEDVHIHGLVFRSPTSLPVLFG